MRTRARFRLRGVIAAVSTVAVAIALVAPASNAAAEPSGSTTCDGLSTGQVSDFVADWAAHLDDDAFMKAYLKGKGTAPLPDASQTQKACLTARLVAELTVRHPGFGKGRDPEAVQALLTSIVFDRGQTKDKSSTTDVPSSDAPSTGLAAALNRLRKTLPTTTVRTASDAALPGASVSTRTAASIGAAGPSASAEVSAQRGATFHPASFLDALLAALPTLKETLDLLGSILASAFYRVCAEAATQPLKCSLPQPLATPIAMDDDGNGVADVFGTLIPNVTAAGSAGLQFQVATIGLLGKTNPAHVYAVFTIPGTNRQFAVGFDGRDSHLGSSQTLTFTLKSIARALQGDIDTSMRVKISNPGARSGITFGVATLGDNHTLTDPISARLDFDPTPTLFTAGLRLQNTATPEYTVGLDSTVPTVLTAHATIAQTAANSMTAVDARIDKLPTSVTVDVKNSGNVLTADYSGTAPIDDLQVGARSVPDLAHPGTYTQLAADLSHIPTDMHLTVTKPYDATLTTSSPIGPSAVSLQNLTDGAVDREIYGSISNVPTSLHLHGDVTGTGDDVSSAFTYTANAAVNRIEARLYDNLDLHAFVDATVQDLPKFMRVALEKHPHDSSASFDARSQESAAPGSASVGPITVRYTTTGTQLADADLPATDHLVLKETATGLRAALRYTGLALVSYSLHDDVSPADADTASAELKNSSPRVLTIVGETPALTLNAVVNSLPADMRMDYAKHGTRTDLHYHASGPIASITSAVSENGGNHAAVGASITNVPDDIAIAMDQAAGTIDWLASGRVGSLGLQGRVDFDGHTWQGGATLSGVAPRWSLHFGSDAVSFQAGTVANPDHVDALEAALTNHGTGAGEAGNHAIANFDQATGNLDASFRISDIESFSFTTTETGFVTKANVGGGHPFHVKADLRLRDDAATAAHLDTIAADATIDPLPTSMTFTKNGTALDFTSNTSPNLVASIATGRADAVAATDDPPVVRGVSMRDGRACDGVCATANKIHVFMEGAPSGFHADLKNVDFGITHYAPPAGDPSLNADVALTSDPDPTKHFIAQVSLKGIDPSGTDMHVGPITTTDGPVEHSAKTTVHYEGNHSVGPLDATVVQGDKTARAIVSNLPADMTFTATTRPDGIVITGDMQDPITSIQAFYKPTGAATWALTGSLGQIPRHFTFSQLTIGEQPSSDPCAPPPPKPPVPTVDYTASNGDDDPNTLDISAAVDLHQLSESLSGQVQAGITNLGHETHASWDGTNLTLDSNPRTESFEVHVPNAQVIVDFAFDTSAPDPCNPSSGHDFISITAAGHVHVVIDIADAGMVLTDVAHIVLQPGFSSGITGDFGTFGFHWGGLHASVDAEAHVDLVIDFGGGIKVSPTLASLDATVGTDVHVDFGIYHQNANRILHLFPIVPVPCDFEGPIPTGVYFIDVFITPERTATGHDGFEVTGTPGSTQQFVITANPFGIIPDVVLDAVTGLFTSPFDKGLDAGFNCS